MRVTVVERLGTVHVIDNFTHVEFDNGAEITRMFLIDLAIDRPETGVLTFFGDTIVRIQASEFSRISG